jgi:hypothetical protein
LTGAAERTDTVAKRRSKKAGAQRAGARRHAWPNLASLVDDGHAQVDINGGGYGLDIAADQVCMFHCGGMTFEAIMDHLEELATRYVDEGIVTDEVNGQEWSVE